MILPREGNCSRTSQPARYTAAVSTSSFRFDQLTYSYGPRRVLDRVAGTTESGEMLLIEGSNGSGKSTLIRCLAGLQRPQAGSIQWIDQGRELDDVARRRGVGWVGPDLSFYEALSAAENLDFFARLRGLAEDPAVEILERLGVPPQRLVGALSSGMLQRLRWSFALQHRPGMLLLDEPFQNLDSAGEDATRALLRQHLEAGGMAIVASPIDLGLASGRRLVLDPTRSGGGA